MQTESGGKTQVQKQQMHNVKEDKTMGVTMKKNQTTGHARFVRNATAAAVMAACASSAMAWDYESDGGWKINVSTVVSASSSWRVESRDKSLIFRDDATAAGLAPPVAGSYNSTAANIGTPAAPGAALLGYTAGARTDSSSLNYDKGDRYSTIFKFITDIEFKKGDTGGLIRFKGWYDEALKDETVPYGHQNNGYAGAIGSGSATTAKTPGGARLSDVQFDPLNRFDGLYLLDAYVYTGFDLGSMPTQVRIGRQAVNWGESLYVQGVNQLAPLDVPSLRRAGTEIKEALLPVWSITGNVGLGGGMSLDAYYQLKWERTAIDYCGTYWAPSEGRIGTGATACDMVTAVTGSNAAYYNGFSAFNNPLVGPFSITTYAHGKDFNNLPKDSGQWGVAFHFPVEALDTEFGVYGMNIHPRTPVVSGVNATTAGIAKGTAAANALLGAIGAAGAIGFALGNAGSTFTGGWEYPGNIKIFGLSAAFNVSGVSVGVEASYQKDVPVQINGNDLLNGIFGYALGQALIRSGGPLVATGTATYNGSGPLTARLQAAGDGGKIQGYDLFNKKQLQVNAVGSLPAMLGATNGLMIAEAAFQWNNVPTATPTSIHYGRGFVFGAATSPTWGGALASLVACAGPANLGGSNWYTSGCATDGFVTDFAWGYRLKASLDYPGFMDTGWVATPSIFFAHDVSGFSMDNQFNEGKKTVSLGLKFNLNKTHNFDFTWTTYANTAKFDPYRDRDNASVSYSYTF